MDDYMYNRDCILCPVYGIRASKSAGCRNWHGVLNVRHGSKQDVYAVKTRQGTSLKRINGYAVIQALIAHITPDRIPHQHFIPGKGTDLVPSFFFSVINQQLCYTIHK